MVQKETATPSVSQAARIPNSRFMRAMTRASAMKNMAFARGFVLPIDVNCCAVNIPIRISIDK
jgi:hypothetical protein